MYTNVEDSLKDVLELANVLKGSDLNLTDAEALGCAIQLIKAETDYVNIGCINDRIEEMKVIMESAFKYIENRFG